MTHSEWAAPIVAVLKLNGWFRTLAIGQYPLPQPEELFAALAGGKKFSKIDLSQAYTQIVLDENSSPGMLQLIHIRCYINTKDYLME